MHPGNAEAFTFIIIIPLLFLFSLILEILFDNPSKDFSNQLCKLMLKKEVEDKNAFNSFYIFMIDIC
jgi:hypothetical protein